MIAQGGVFSSSIDDLNELLGGELPNDDWDTVGGLIFHDLGHVPEIGESIAINGVRLHVEAMEGRRITRVRVDRTETTDD